MRVSLRGESIDGRVIWADSCLWAPSPALLLWLVCCCCWTHTLPLPPPHALQQPDACSTQTGAHQAAAASMRKAPLLPLHDMCIALHDCTVTSSCDILPFNGELYPPLGTERIPVRSCVMQPPASDWIVPSSTLCSFPGHMWHTRSAGASSAMPCCSFAPC